MRAALWMLPAVLLLLITYFVPLLDVLTTSVTEPRPGLNNYAGLLTDTGAQRIILTTLRISLTATLIAVGLGYLVAYAMVTGSPRRRVVMFACVMVPFWISILVRTFAWILLLRTEGIVNNGLITLHLIDDPLDMLYSETGVLIGTVHYMVPIAAMTLYGQMEGIDQRLITAARGLGAGPVFAFRTVFLPLSLPGIAAASVLIFIGGIGYFIVPALLGGGKTLMLAEYIGLLITTTVNWGLGTALATVLVAIVLMLLFAVSRLVDIRRAFGST
ncbi:ABC transporter permease [Lichenihabitans sp. Uapishka_5]|uniref:ABC transporter permease n=1 Tax=Lichenihabitans sp. Uapishka_5 TaxID=3037302 RepID=UPI0029E80478|nr:ABC transporter permease [Lichenihabitans sp. Uapishka_5]MDX7951753.1 ABC transporter permease [Lichenihabitans sp. Uapishka_5]